MTPEMMAQFPFLLGGAQPQAQGQPTVPQTGEVDLGGGISAAPQAVSTPVQGAGGAGHSGTTQTPGLQQQWQSYLQHPATTAMLLAMGIEMMKPRWEPMSALPDALSSGVRAQGAYYEDQQKRSDAERDFNRETAAQDEKEERATERTRIAASSREEVARANNDARMQREIYKGELKSGPQSSQEKAFWSRQYAAHKRMLEAANKDARDPLNKRLNPELKEMTPQEIDAEAKSAADTALSGYRVRFGGAGGAGSGGHMQQNTQQTTSGNSQTPAPAGGNSAAPHAAQNSANNVATGRSAGTMTVAEIEGEHPGLIAEALKDPARAEKLRQLLKPEEWHKIQALPKTGTIVNDPISRKYEGGYVGR
jgi:hypothetical protein